MELGVVRKPNVFDVVNISTNARQSDKDEAFLFVGKTLQQALEDTPDLYNTSYVWEVGGKLVCMFGVTPSAQDEWIIWMLATDEFEKYRKIFKAHCKKVFSNVIEGKKYLFNYVHAKHTRALKWVRWLGFRVGEPLPIGINGELFCKIEMNNV